MLVCVSSHNLAHETAGAARIPAFPAPSDDSGRETKGITRANRAAGTRRCVFSLAPRLRGEGRGEGLSPRGRCRLIDLYPLTRRCAPTSPRKRGEVTSPAPLQCYSAA